MVNYISGLVFVVLAIVGLAVSAFVGWSSGNAGVAVVIGLIWLFLDLVASSAIRLAAQWEKAVIFRLGRLKGHRGPGLYFLIPFIERRVTVDLRTITQQLDTQETLSSDGVAVKVNAVLWYRAADPERTVVSVANWRRHSPALGRRSS